MEIIDEFPINQKSLPKLEKVKCRIQKYYFVDIVYGLDVSDNDIKQKWITVHGRDKEQVNKAKEYIKNLCNATEELVMDYPPHLRDVLRDRHLKLEEQSGAALLFEGGRLTILGSDITVTLAMSAVEDLLGRYENTEEGEIVDTPKKDHSELNLSRLVRQDSAASRLEKQLRDVCELHDISYEDYSHAPNSVKRVLLSWLTHDMDFAGDELRSDEDANDSECDIVDVDLDKIKTPKPSHASHIMDHSVICLDTPVGSASDRSVICLDDTLTPKVSSSKHTLSSPEDDLLTQAPLSMPLASSVFEKGVIEFSLKKGYTDKEIRTALINHPGRPFRCSSILAALHANRKREGTDEPKPSVSGTQTATVTGPSPDRGEEVATTNDTDWPVASPVNDDAVKDYFKRLYQDFNEETPNLSREQLLRRNRERQELISKAKNSSKSETESIVIRPQVEEEKNNGSDKGKKNKKDKKRKKKAMRNQGEKSQTTSQSESETGISTGSMAPNNGTSPLPQNPKKQRHIKDTREASPQHMKNMDTLDSISLSSDPQPLLQHQQYQLQQYQQQQHQQYQQQQQQQQRQVPVKTLFPQQGERQMEGASFQTGNRKQTSGQYNNNPPNYDQNYMYHRQRQYSGDQQQGACANPKTKAGQHLRPIVIDGSNVAVAHGKHRVFSCRGLQICVDFFLKRGHTEITAFVPNWRRGGLNAQKPTVDGDILGKLEAKGYLSFTPSRHVKGRRITCYDDRFIIELASQNDGVIISNDNYRDLINQSLKWRDVIEKRLLMYTFAGDNFMIPDDPLGANGPSIDEYLLKAEFLQPQRGNFMPIQSGNNYNMGMNGNYMQQQQLPRQPAHIPKDTNNPRYPGQSKPPQQQQQQRRSPNITRQLYMELCSIFQNLEPTVQRILDNHPYETNLNKLTTHMLDVVNN